LHYTSINAKWVKDLSVRFETVKLIQGKIGNTLDHIGIGSNFMNGIPIVQQLRGSNDKWDYMKLQSFCTAKETVTRLKRKPTEAYISSYISDKGLMTRIYRELKN
jgi:hypothetical protein